ncbi:MAG: hypothetical protein L0229_27420 [Blastocatellia bacterium]|nr:hypothetical protein [Blastocatellia bacterium]
MRSFRPRNITECLQIIWRRKALILFVAVVVLISATITILNIPYRYESSALIVVSGRIYDREANGAQIAYVTEQVRSRANLEALIKRYSLYSPAPKMDLALEQMQGDIKLETKYRSDSDGFPESFTLAYRHTDPLVAKQVVTDMVSVFDRANETLRQQAAEEAEAIRAEIADIESRLAGVTDARASAAARNRAASRAVGNLERLRAERKAVAASVEALNDRKYRLEREIAEQKRLIAQQQERVRKAPPPDDTRTVNSYGALLKTKADLEAKIKDYSAAYTDKHPQLVEAREQLAEINRQIAQAASSGEKARAAASSPEAIELRSLQRELAKLEMELDVVMRELNRKQQAGAKIPDVPRAEERNLYVAPVMTGGGAEAEERNLYSEYEYEGLRERYSALLKREDALREFQPSTAGPGAKFFQMIDSPNLPQTPSTPNRRRLILFALALALGAGLVMAAAVEVRRLSLISDDRDVSYYLGVPVVALIPETFSPAEKKVSRRSAFKRKLTYFLIGTAAIPALFFILSNLNIFEILGKK